MSDPLSLALSRTIRCDDGVAIHVRQWGDGPPLLLIHGLGTSADLWVHQVPVLGRTHRLIAVDLRGFGRSSRPSEPGSYAIPRLARDVLAVAEELEIERAHVLGASMGGFIAQTIALARPSFCRSLILAHTGSRMSIPPDVVESRLAVLRSKPMDEYAELVATQALAPGVDAAVRAWLVRMIAANDARAYEQVLTEGLFGFEITERVGAIRIPTLVIVGEHDRVIPPDEGRALSRRIPGAELFEFGGVGHIGYAERPGPFNDAVAAFLARVEGRAQRG